MNFARARLPHGAQDEPEINLIPLIDVLLVILIFLAASTTFLRQGALAVALPEAQARAAPPATLTLAISREGRYALDGVLLDDATHQADADAGLSTEFATVLSPLSTALRAAAHAQPEAVLVIQADAHSTHQSVVTAMQAAQDAGIARLHFAARAAAPAPGSPAIMNPALPGRAH